MEGNENGKVNLEEALKLLETGGLNLSGVSAHIFTLIAQVGEGKMPAERALLQLVSDYVTLRSLEDKIYDVVSFIRKHVDNGS